VSVYLLDTHVLIWLVNRQRRIPTATRALLADEANALLVSAVTAMEITTKYRLGKMPEAEPFVRDWSGALDRLMATEVPLTPAQGFAAGGLAWPHGDPFDRMLAAQAMNLKVPFVSGDKVMSTLPGLDLRW
jgi:PIN domain nuclease of toxin-antitoxin system